MNSRHSVAASRQSAANLSAEERGPHGPELVSLARRLIWWMPPGEALGERSLFLARVMTLGTWDAIELVRREWGDEVFGETLDNPPAGIFDLASWHYWHRRLGRRTIPPLPKRIIP